MRRDEQLQTRPRTARRRVLLATLLAIAALAGAPAADAQIEYRSFYHGYNPTVSGEDVEALVETLGIDEDGEALVRSVYDGYRNAYNTAADAARDELRRVRESMKDAENPGVQANLYAEYNRMQDGWGQRARQLETGFFADIRNLITEEQARQWPRFERDRRRRVALLLAARLAAERVDLVDVLDRLDLPDEVREACEPVVEQYTIEFDAPLSARIMLSDQLERLSYERGAKVDAAQMNALEQRLIRLHVEIRDVNLQYAEAIARQLPPEDGRRFTDAFQRRVWPRVFAGDEVGADVERVKRLAALRPGQDEAIAGIVAGYRARVEPINRELVQVELGRELQRLSPPEVQGSGKAPTGGADSPEALEDQAQSLLDARRALIRSTLADIRTVLTAEQLRALTQGTPLGEEEQNRQ